MLPVIHEDDIENMDGLHPRQDNRRPPSLKKEAVAAAAWMGANASGFAAYKGTAVALSAGAKFFGATLPFGTYTTASTVLSCALGPVGLGVVAACAIVKVLSTR